MLLLLDWLADLAFLHVAVTHLAHGKAPALDLESLVGGALEFLVLEALGGKNQIVLVNLLSVFDKASEYEVVLDTLVGLESHAVDLATRLPGVNDLDAGAGPVHIDEPLVHLLVLEDHVEQLARGDFHHGVQP